MKGFGIAPGEEGERATKLDGASRCAREPERVRSRVIYGGVTAPS